MKKINQYDLLLLLTSILWGYGFVAVANCLNDGFSVFFILFIRFFIAAVAMAVGAYNHYTHINKHDLMLGALSGLFLFLAFCLQSYGLSMTTPSNNAFLCSISVIIVPMLIWGIDKKKPGKNIIVSLVLCVAGMWVLTGGISSGSFNAGDFLSLASSFVFALQVLLIGRYSRNMNIGIFNLVQMSTVSLLALASCLVFTPDSFDISMVFGSWFDLLYLGLVATCLCYLLQAIGLKNTSTTKASIILATESLFGSLLSVLCGLEPFTSSMMIGGALILTSLICAEVKFNKKV